MLGEDVGVLLNRIPAVQECDATMLNRKTKADNKKKNFLK
jgi:hypothetical protein